MDRELTPEEEEIVRTSVSRGYTPKREVTEPEDPPAGSAGTSQAAED
ncbi:MULTISPECIES: hypothetical protein [Amycolatopsis]|uniref:Uncharacterized protein n=1 Tax=Amycolatopsis thermalba TaxID=944492 RepID=A0ABY4NYM6_9PSEU|nr:MULTISPECIES: hypothetical protein [Amycolatopsis]UQS25190.1 hypothetical protein L1857_21415 [Amycolatopsis thermalba]